MLKVSEVAKQLRLSTSPDRKALAMTLKKPKCPNCGSADIWLVNIQEHSELILGWDNRGQLVTSAQTCVSEDIEEEYMFCSACGIDPGADDIGGPPSDT